MHPLIEGLQSLSDTDLEKKITDLQKRYFMTSNVELQHQISLALDTYKLEMQQRQLHKKKAQQENGDSDLDNLINVS